MSDYYQVKNQNIFNPPANTYLGNATNQFNSVYVQNDLVLGNVTVTGSTIVAPKVSTITYPGDDTAADTAGGQTITLTGAGFVVGASVLINGSAVSVVSVVSSTTITFTSPANSTGSYVIYVINPDGSTAIAIPGIQYSGTPNWTTAAGSLGNVYETASFNQTVTATGDAPITYSVYSGTLPPGATFNSNGTISGTSQLLSSPTTYTFTIRATDAQQQDTDRSFSLTVTPDVVTWSNPTNNMTYTPAANVAIANITLSATSAVGSGITYSANTLPTGLSLTGANISGTPTVAANTSSLLTATANTTSESSSITINWVVSVASDPYFMYNTLLLSGNGTNNANNNTFVDGSTNNFTITRNGNTTQGTFSPYGPNWSNYFDGSGDSIQAPSGSSISGTGNFTVELWINPTSFASGYKVIYANDTSGGFSFTVNSTGTLGYGRSLVATDGTTTGTVNFNQWNHIAFVRSGTGANQFICYINGVNAGSFTNSTNYTAGVVRIGTDGGGSALPYLGYISNLRTTTTAVYTSNFDPPTTPLTAISGTSLLTCQSNRFIDNSTNNYTITRNGDTSVQRFSPFSPGSAYSTSVIGGSGYFDGTGDYLSLASTTALQMSGDFTWEAWVYPLSLPGSTLYKTFWSQRSSGSVIGGPTVAFNSTGTIFLFIANSNAATWAIATFNTGFTVSLNQWQHIALVKSGTSIKLYKNGVAGTATTSSEAVGANGNTTLMAGSADGSQIVDGYMSDFRAVKGTAVYTTNFTPPSAPLSAIANTQLLTNFTNAGIIDNTMINNLETVGDAKISTAQSKFGGGSMSFDGTGDYLTIPSSANLNFGTADFTVECWAYFNSLSNSPMIWHKNSANSGWFFEAATNTLYFGYAAVSSSQYYQLTGITLTTSTWYHLAVTRVGATLSIFINGIKYSSTVSSANSSFDNSAAFIIGSFYPNNNTYDLNGYINDFRITKGYARYTSNFTPPTSAFPTY